MRITNNMMINNTSKNINGNKVGVNDLNLQMASQKKIQRPSDDPVVAIRALRLRSTLSKVNQYYERNIPDAQTWLEVTETALKNMNKILTDVKTQCVNGTNSYMTAEDRSTILKSLTALKTQLYSEGNADNAGRTVFTGYKTSSQLTFMEDDAETSYNIEQRFTYKDIEAYTYYSGSIEVPNTVADVQNVANIGEISKTNYERLRLAYDEVEMPQTVSYSYGDTRVEFTPVTDAAGNVTYTATNQTGAAVTDVTFTVYESQQAWDEATAKTVGENEIVFIQNTGELVLGNTISNNLKSQKASFEVEYQKTGFAQGELRPEYYYNCTDVTDPNNEINYVKYDENGNKIYEDINYTVALNQTLKVNMQADEIFDMSIYQDVVEMTDAVQSAINAHEKLDTLKAMKNQAQYAACQDEVQKWIDAAQKEADYADKQLTELYSAGIGKFDGYMNKLNVAYTEIGTRGDQLEMTESRMSEQQLTVKELKSTNEDRELSDIIIDYTAAYNAYQASLLSASKIEKQTLLNYI